MPMPCHCNLQQDKSFIFSHKLLSLLQNSLKTEQLQCTIKEMSIHAESTLKLQEKDYYRQIAANYMMSKVNCH